MSLIIAWYIIPYKRKDYGIDAKNRARPTRYLPIDDYTSRIFKTDGGSWSECEIPGNRAIVKVKASADTLLILDSLYYRIPIDDLNIKADTATKEKRDKIEVELMSAGYSKAGIDDHFKTGIAEATLKQILDYASQCRDIPRYDKDKDEIVFDLGIRLPGKTIEQLNAEVK